MKILDSTFLVICAENDLKYDVNPKFYIVDLKINEIAHTYAEIDKYKGRYMHFQHNRNYTVINDSVFYYEPHDNTIAYLDKNQSIDYLKLDFGKYEAPNSFYSQGYENVMVFFEKFHDRKYASGIHWIIWNKSKIAFQFLHNQKIKIAIIDRLSNIAEVGEGIYIEGNTVEDTFISDNNLISYIYTEDDSVKLFISQLK